MPTLEEFITKAAPLNPTISEDGLAQYWEENYAQTDIAPTTDTPDSPSWEEFQVKAAPLNPEMSPRELNDYWKAEYGVETPEPPSYLDAIGSMFNQAANVEFESPFPEKVEAPVEPTVDSSGQVLVTQEPTWLDKGEAALKSFGKSVIDTAALVAKDVEVSRLDHDWGRLSTLTKAEKLSSPVLEKLRQDEITALQKKLLSKENAGGYFNTSEWIKSLGPSLEDIDPELRESFGWVKTPAGLGSAATFMGLTAALGRFTRGKGSGNVVTQGTAAVKNAVTVASLGSMVQGASEFEEALNNGASLEDAFASRNIGHLVGTSEAVPLARILNRLDKASAGTIKKTIKNMLVEGTEEAIQEAFQTVMSNLIKSDLVGYAPDQGLWTDAEDGAAVGFTTGTILSFFGSLVAGRRMRNFGKEMDAAVTGTDLSPSENVATTLLDPASYDEEILPPESQELPVPEAELGDTTVIPQQQAIPLFGSSDEEILPPEPQRLPVPEFNTLELLNQAVSGVGPQPVEPVGYTGLDSQIMAPTYSLDTSTEELLQSEAALADMLGSETISPQPETITYPPLEEYPRLEITDESIEPTDATLRTETLPAFLPKGYEPSTQEGEMEPTLPVDQPVTETTETDFSALQIVEVPVDELQLSEDVPQFKSGADDSGVIDPLGGTFDRTGVGPIQIWVRENGNKEVISGRHRLDLARRSGEETIPAQYHYEGEGFGQKQAASLDAILNIRDGQGEVQDYVEFFRNSSITQEYAEEQGLLARAKGKMGYGIATQGDDVLIEAHRSGSITDQQAFRVSAAAPSNARLQTLGLVQLQNGKSIAYTENMMRAVQSMGGESDASQGDMFGLDDSAVKEAEALAQAASNKQKNIQARIAAGKGAAKNPGEAKKLGIDVRDPKSVLAQLTELRAEKDRWSNWHTDPELVAELREDAGLEQQEEKFNLDTQTEESLQQREEQQTEAQTKEDIDKTVDGFDLAGQDVSTDESMDQGDLLSQPEESTEEGPTVKRGTVGMMLATDEVVATQTGRETTPFPTLRFGTDRKATNTDKRVTAWLINNAIDEAKSRGDEINTLQFEAIDLKNVSQADKDSAEEYLFGESVAPIVPKILKPLIPETDQTSSQVVPELTKSGKPYKSKKSAQTALKLRREYSPGTHKVVEVDAGFGIVEKTMELPAPIESRSSSVASKELEVPPSTLIQTRLDLIERIKRTEEQFSSSDPYVVQMKDELRALNTRIETSVTEKTTAPDDVVPQEKMDEIFERNTKRFMLNTPERRAAFKEGVNQGWYDESQGGHKSDADIKILGKPPGYIDGYAAGWVTQSTTAQTTKKTTPAPKTPPKQIESLIEQYNATGRVAFHYPRKKEISLDGRRSMKEGDAIEKMREVITRKKEESVATKPETTDSDSAREVLKRYVKNFQGINNLYGKRNADTRQKLMSELVGKKVPKTQSGVNALIDKVFEVAGVEATGKGDTRAAKEKRFDSWLAGAETDIPTNTTADLLGSFAQEQDAVAADWASRKYKDNDKVIDLSNNELSTKGYNSIGNINAQRRARKVEEAKGHAKLARQMAEKIRAGEVSVEEIVEKAGKKVANMEVNGQLPDDLSGAEKIQYVINKELGGVGTWGDGTLGAKIVELNKTEEQKSQAHKEKFTDPETGEVDLLAAFLGDEDQVGKPVPTLKPTSITPSAPIEDVGEKIGGARKDVWGGFREKVEADLNEDELLNLPLSKAFPEPNYEKLIEQGVPVETLAIIKVMRDEIPVKGRQTWKRKRWAKGVSELRSAASMMMDDPSFADKFLSGMRDKKGSLDSLAKQVDLMVELGFPQVNAAGHTIEYQTFKERNPESEKLEEVSRWMIKDTKSKRGWPYIGRGTESREEAVEVLKAHLAVQATRPKGKRATKFDIYKYRGKQGKRGWIIGKKVGRSRIDLKEGFDDQYVAREYLEGNQVALEERLAKLKEIPDHRKESNEPRLGEDYRQGKDVGAEEFRETFGFRGVEFGNWVDQVKRQQDINEAYDGLMDLAILLDVPPKALSLNSELGIAFGARGKGGKGAAKAHYEPGKIVINLTKKDGAGSLAHEWWHGLDNYFSRMRGDKVSYLTDSPRTKKRQVLGGWEDDTSIRPEMVARFKGVVDAIKATDLPTRAKELDGRRTKEYWATTIEMSARSFESYVIGRLKEKGLSNDYLANIVSPEYWDAANALGLESTNSYPYLLEQEMEAVTAAYDTFFQEAQTKDTEQGVKIYEPSEEYEASSVPSTGGEVVLGGQSAKEVVQTLRRHKTSTLANGLAKGFIDQSHVKLIGQKIKSAEDLAILGQVYRNPSFETFRLFYTKGKAIVGQTGITSRVPNQVQVGDISAEIVRDMDRLGADGWWLLHNHPSGVPKPSKNDIQFTRNMIERTGKAESFRGHVVIDHDKYGLIDMSKIQYGQTKVIPLPKSTDDLFRYDVNDPKVPHTLLGYVIKNSTAAAALAKSLAHDQDNYFQIVSRNQTGIQGIMDVPVKLLENLNQDIEGKKAEALVLLRKFQRQTGGGELFAMNVPRKYAEIIYKSVKKGVFLDVITLDGDSIREGMLVSEEGFGWEDNLKSIRVREESGEFSPIEFTPSNNNLYGNILNNKLASVYKDQGWKNAYQQNDVPESLREFTGAVEAALGRRIIYVTPTKEIAEGFLHGVYWGGKNLYVSTEGTSQDLGFVNIAGHEFLHSLKGSNPDLYSYLLGNLLRYTDSSAVERYRTELDARLNEDETGHTTEVAEEELLADFTGDSFADPEFLQQLADDNPSKFKQFLDAVLKFYNKIANKLKLEGLGSSEYFNDIDAMRQHLRKAVDAYVNGESIVDATQDIPNFMVAWHGTPHEVDQFSSEKIGTGEGAAAYGHGLYFAGKREVAEWYKDALQDSKLSINGVPVRNQSGGNIDIVALENVLTRAIGSTSELELPFSVITKMAAILRRSSSAKDASNELLRTALSLPLNALSTVDKIEQAAKWVREADIEYVDSGNLYQVELAPSEDEYLLWDKPLNEQSEKVRETLLTEYRKALKERNWNDLASKMKNFMLYDEYEGRDVYRGIVDFLSEPSKQAGEILEAIGRDPYGDLSAYSNKQLASEYLHSLGIRGIKYEDGASRGKNIKTVMIDGVPAANFPYEQSAADLVIELGSVDVALEEGSPEQGVREILEDWAESEVTIEDGADYNYVIFDDADVEIEARFSRQAPQRPQVQNDEQVVFIGKGPDNYLISNHPSLKDRSRLSREFSKYFASKGNLSQEAFNLKIEMEGMKGEEEVEVADLAMNVRRVAKTAYGKRYNKLSDGQKIVINSRLQGEDVELPGELNDAVDAMRIHLDGLSGKMQAMLLENISYRLDSLPPEKGEAALAEIVKMRDAIANGATNLDEAELTLDEIDPYVANKIRTYFTIEGNKGHYLNRSYQAFDDPAWANKVRKDEAVMEAARNYFRDRISETEELEGDVLETRVNGTINSILNAAIDKRDMLSFLSSPQLGQKNLGILKQRKELDPAVMDLLGVYTDPLANYSRTATKMSWLVANHTFLKGIRDQGLGSFLSTRATERMSSVVRPFDPETMSPVTGLYATPEFAEALREATDPDNASVMIKFLRKINGVVKFGKVAIAPTTQVRNFLSAGIGLMMNGHFNLLHTGKALSVTWNDLRSTGKKKEYIKELVREGVLHNSVRAGEMTTYLDDVVSSDKWASGIRGGVKRSGDFFATLYRMGDDFWKVIAYENEKASLKRWYGLSETEAKKKAAERIRNGYMTYSHVPKAIRHLRRNVLMGAFVSFPAEVIRTTKNQFVIMGEDAAAGHMAPVARRMVGMATAFAVLEMLAEQAMDAVGLDDDDDEAMHLLSAEYQRNSRFYYSRDSKGNLVKMDLSYMDLYGNLKRPIYALLNDNNEGAIEKLGDAITEIAEPFIGWDILSGAVFEVLANKKRNGGQVYNETDSREEQAAAIAEHLARAAAPGVATNIERTWKASQGEVSSSGRKYTLRDEAAALGGMRWSTVDIPTAMRYRIGDFKHQRSEASRILSKELRNPNKLSRKDLKAIWTRMSTARDRVFSETHKLVVAAQKLGMTEKQLNHLINANGVGNRDRHALMTGTPSPYRLTKVQMKGIIKRALGGVEDPVERAKIKERVQERFQMLLEIQGRR